MNKYESWINVNECDSFGRVYKIIGWIGRDIDKFKSDFEIYYFIIKQWDDEQ